MYFNLRHFEDLKEIECVYESLRSWSQLCLSELLLLRRLEFCATRLDCDLSIMSHDLNIVSHDLSISTRLDYGLTAITNTTWSWVDWILHDLITAWLRFLYLTITTWLWAAWLDFWKSPWVRYTTWFFGKSCCLCDHVTLNDPAVVLTVYLCVNWMGCCDWSVISNASSHWLRQNSFYLP